MGTCEICEYYREHGFQRCTRTGCPTAQSGAFRDLYEAYCELRAQAARPTPEGLLRAREALAGAVEAIDSLGLVPPKK